jgi:membrane-associated phospholipid phosphatase
MTFSMLSTSGGRWSVAVSSWFSLIGAVVLLGIGWCAKDNALMQVRHDEPIRWADTSVGSELPEPGEADQFELAQLEAPEPDALQNQLDKVGPSDSVLDIFETEVSEVPNRTAWAILLDDQREFYSRQNVRPAIFTLGAAAILANTDIDQEFADWYQDDVRTESLDDIADVAKLFGEQWPMVGLYVSTSVIGRCINVDPRFAKWGDRSLRSMFVGVPPLLFLQKAIGSSRPNDTPPSSEWDFFGDDNGASGHTFVGAVPFLVAAQLAERPGAKATWLALSTLTGWSRINDDDHYLSQVIVGWWLAYAATRSVERSDEQAYEIAPALIGDTLGVEATWRR